ncbi:unnamed protein product [Symbiodinium sp. CCMP2592]|nr:unnamed protein product [Symbiodinium sp. CCMP2592]
MHIQKFFYVFDISDNDVVADFYDDFPEELAVRAVSVRSPPSGGTDQEQDPVTIVLDTGADAGMVPEAMRAMGEPLPSNAAPPRLTDAQGNDIPTEALRRYAFELRDHRGQSFIIKETCVVGRVRVPLLAAGKLLKQGWQLVSEEDPRLYRRSRVILRSPAGLRAPVAFKHNSLVVQGEVRAITEIPRSLPPKVPKVTISAEMEALVGNEGMRVLGNGIKMHYQAAATDLLDPRPWYDATLHKARTTLYRTSAGFWLQVENSADYLCEKNPFTLVTKTPKPRITLIGMDAFEEGFFPEGGVAPKPSELVVESHPQPQAPRTPEPPEGELAERPAERQGEPAERRGEPAERRREPAERPGSQDADMGASEPGDVQDLPGAPAGLEQHEFGDYVAANAAQALEGIDRRDPVPRGQPESAPDDAAVALHNLTHMPFASWCEACVRTRSRGDRHSQGANREVRLPIVQVDFYFASLEEGEQENCILIGVDLDTKMVLAVPGPNKGAVILAKATEEIVRFTLALHQEQAVIVQSDGEPAIKAVVRAVAAARARLGRKTVQRATPVAAHESNGAAVHAAFVHNRFHVIPGLQQTPFEIAFGGKRFDQKLCEFGDTVYGQVFRTNKAEPRWVKAIWVGMNPHSGANNLMTVYGHIQSASVRRAAPDQQLTADQIKEGGYIGEQPASPPKRKAEAEPSSAGAVEKRKAEEMAQGNPSSSSGSSDGGGSIRMVETVDADWAEHGPDIEAEIAADGQESTEDPPSLSVEELAVLDDAAELEEIERLEKMTVLVDPVAGEEAEQLSTVFVKTWKYDKTRSRAPASVTTLARMVPLLAQQWNTPVWVMDIKDAFLQVEQPANEPVLVTSPRSYTAKSVDLESMEEVPTLFRARAGRYAVKVNGPFHLPGDMYEFLRRRHQFEPDGSITIRAATRFYQDLYELAGRPKARSTPGPSGKEDMFDLDSTKALESGEATLYRTMLGKLLYVGGTAGLPSGHTVPLGQGIGTDRASSQAPASVMQLTGDRQGEQGGGEHSHLIGGFSDSNFANDRTTRRSLSSGQIFIGQALAYSFVRGQKVVTLSNGEAELVALTQTTSECILVKKAWEFLVQQEATLAMRSDFWVARAIASRLGVGRVRHLQTSCLWIQQWVAQHLLKVLAVPTEFNPADLGRKRFTTKRLRLLCYLVGLVHDNGEHVGQNEFREATARRAGRGDRNNDVVVRLVQLLAAATLQGCEFGPAGPNELFEDLASLLYFLLEATERDNQEESEHDNQEESEHNNQEATDQEAQNGNTNNNHELHVPTEPMGTANGLIQKWRHGFKAGYGYPVFRGTAYGSHDLRKLLFDSSYAAAHGTELFYPIGKQVRAGP